MYSEIVLKNSRIQINIVLILDTLTINLSVLTKHEIAKEFPPVAIQAAPDVNKETQSTGYLITGVVQLMTKSLIASLTAPPGEVQL